MDFERVLVVIAHPDDELMCYGTLAKLIASGSEIRVLLSMSPGKIRGEEFLASMDILGLTSNHWRIMHHDQDLFSWNRETIQPYDREFLSFNPDLVIGHRVQDTQQHHSHLANIMRTICRRNQTDLWEIEQAFPGGIDPDAYAPNTFVDVTDFWHLKEQCVSVYASQSSKYANWIQALSDRGRAWGWQTNIEYDRKQHTPYIEAFRAVKQFWF
jgi:LmbE family N-acetylglucosaminyl deacetylase